MGRRRRGAQDSARGEGIVAAALWLALALTQSAKATPAESSCANCHAQLAERLSRPVVRYSRSVHAAARVGCVGCHGGDAAAPIGGPAHAAFPGRPAPAEVAGFCGRCHARALQAYRPSGHARLQGTKPASSCVDCHGSHDVDDPPPGFRLAVYCRSCHGLEYLPRLPQAVGDLIEADDRLVAALARGLGRALSDGDRAEATALRRSLGSLVHAASLAIPRVEVEAWGRRMESLLARVEK